MGLTGIRLGLRVGSEPVPESVHLCVSVFESACLSLRVCVCVCVRARVCVLGRKRGSGRPLILGCLREGSSQHRCLDFLDQKPARGSQTTCSPAHVALACVAGKEQDLLFS